MRSQALESLEQAGLAAFAQRGHARGRRSRTGRVPGPEAGPAQVGTGAAQVARAGRPGAPTVRNSTARRPRSKRRARPPRSRLERRVSSDSAIDVTLPGIRPRLGHRHPLTQTADELIDLFGRFGFSVARGPEVEDVYHNFDALNIPANHPARDPFDNFYLAAPAGNEPGDARSPGA